MSQLVLLLKRAIEFYSAQSNQNFKVYLQKLQIILSNEMAQVLLESESDSMKKPEKEVVYQSIFDLI